MKKIALIFSLALAGFPVAADVTNDYPTEARAEFVLGCMAANGQTPEMLQKCSCSIDVIATLVPYEKYIQMVTVLRMQQVPGDRTASFRGAAWANAMIDELKSAEAESTLKCF
ncbi:MAG: hypothetical protein JKY68_08410 [Rhodospirillales bacterium]|jgi:hypothetical protein|nr:hypothetical protein [Rhodospirillales bacterium]